MGLKLVDLLRWSHEVPLKTPDGKNVERDGKAIVLWQRVIGEKDLEDCYKASRAASARLRATLRDKDSDDYLSTLAIIESADKEQCKEIIISSQRRDNNSLAYANVERPEIPDIDEVAIDADAPTLEEQEKYDALIEKLNRDYLNAIDDYVKVRDTESASELNNLSLEELQDRTIQALIDIQALEIFIKELEVQKAFRGTYMDRYFKELAFDSIDDIKQFKLKDLLITQYQLLEISPDDVKN